MQEMWVQSLGQEDHLDKEMATYTNILAWRIPWTEEPGGLQPLESKRVRHDWAAAATLPTQEGCTLQLTCISREDQKGSMEGPVSLWGVCWWITRECGLWDGQTIPPPRSEGEKPPGLDTPSPHTSGKSSGGLGAWSGQTQEKPSYHVTSLKVLLHRRVALNHAVLLPGLWFPNHFQKPGRLWFSHFKEGEKDCQTTENLVSCFQLGTTSFRKKLIIYIWLYGV